MNSLKHLEAPRRGLIVVDAADEYAGHFINFLRRHGLESAVCHNEADALARVEEEKPELAIVHFTEAMQRSIEFIGVLHSRDPSISIIYVTAYSGESVHRRAIAAGAFVVLEKGVRLQAELSSVIERAVVATIEHRKKNVAGQISYSVSSLRDHVDIAIMTIRDDEFQSVLKRFPARESVSGGKWKYDFCRVRTGDAAETGVAFARFSGQGPGIAQAVARNLIDDLDPQWLLLVGIGGAIPDEEYCLGDVVLATRLNDFSVSAALDGHAREYNVGGGPMHLEVEALLSHLPAMRDRLKGWNTRKSIGMKRPGVEVPSDLKSEFYYGDDEWRKRVRRSLLANFPLGKRPSPPKFYAAPVIGSGVLLKDTFLANEWRKTARHTAVVEMELGGVYLAARYGGSQNYRVVAIRGISDIVGFRRSRDWTAYACNSAGAFAHSLIVNGDLLGTGLK